MILPKTMTIYEFCKSNPGGPTYMTIQSRLRLLGIKPARAGQFLLTDLHRVAEHSTAELRRQIGQEPTEMNGRPIMSASEFCKRHAPHLCINTMNTRITTARIDAVILGRPRYYYIDDLFDVAKRPLADNGVTTRAKIRAEKCAQLASGPSWVKYPIGARSGASNGAGRAIVGIFAGYKGDVLARIRLGREESVFATDAKVEDVPDTVPIDDWHIPPKIRRTFSSTA